MKKKLKKFESKLNLPELLSTSGHCKIAQKKPVIGPTRQEMCCAVNGLNDVYVAKKIFAANLFQTRKNDIIVIVLFWP